MSEQKDFPLAEVAASCERVIADGGFILQKWTCAGCGQRITGTNVNVLVEHGSCEHCYTVTDLTKRGCNFTMLMPSCPMTPEELERILGLNQPGTH